MMASAAPRWPMKLTRYVCGGRGCTARVTLTIIDPLPHGWRVVARGRVPANWAGGVLKVPEGKVGYMCADCARAADEAKGGPR